MSVELAKQVDWAVINHTAQGIASSTDPKIADVIKVSLSMTEITPGLQTMMCCVARCCLSTGGTDINQAEEPVVTKIQINIALGVGGAGM